jgi:hypothetical protein
MLAIPAESVWGTTAGSLPAELSALVTAVQLTLGRDGADHVLELTLEGSWPPEIAPLALHTLDGARLDTVGLEIDYRKDEAGTVLRDETRLQVAIPPELAGQGFVLLAPPVPVFVPQATIRLLPD